MSVALSLGKVTLWPKAATTALVQFLDTVQDLVDAGETVAVFDLSDATTIMVGRDGSGGNPGAGDPAGRITTAQGDQTYYASAPSDNARATWNSGGYLELDGVDDGYDLGVTPADDMTLIVAMRTSDQLFIVGDDYLNNSGRFLLLVQDNPAPPLSSNAGTPSFRLNGVDKAWVNREDPLADVPTGNMVVLTQTNLSLSGWDALSLGAYAHHHIDGDIAWIGVFTGLTAEQLEIIEAEAARAVGLTL